MSTPTSDLPIRSHMDDPDIVWREGEKPDYSKVDKAYIEGRSKDHAQDSLEKTVENMVKSWEMESAHKLKAENWRTVNKEMFTISANGGHKFNLTENIQLGNYNMFLQECPLYDASKHTHESSHELFRTVFPDGFPWEVLEIISGPPRVCFTWRHWGHWKGEYVMETPPTGDLMEMVGMAMVTLDEDSKVTSIEVYYDPNILLLKLVGKDKCPFLA